MKHIFIVNPAAGATDATAFVERSIKELNTELDYEVYTTKAPGDATRYIRSLLEGSNDEYRFYACGGDGTLNEVANGAVGFENASITVFPCGSGNDFIKYYGTAADFSDIKALTEGESLKIDVLKVCGKYAVNAVHFGLDTFVLRTMLKVRRKPIIGGRNAYTTGVVAALIKGMKTKCRLIVDDSPLGKDKMLLCTLSNGRYVGGAYKCAPRSLNDDGLIEVCHVSPVSRLKFLTLMGKYKEGSHLDNPKFKNFVSYTKAKKIEIKGNDNFYISIDGELEKVDECTVEIVKQALNFTVPKRLAPTSQKEKVKI
ncbi:MAG: diacylglycerol kinase family lipid kinase [Clostridia bacterium]|nr:diacylglycerol kinase family lipid kinase [Clostridia bacterium]